MREVTESKSNEKHLLTKNKRINEVLEGEVPEVKLSWEEVIDMINESIDDQILDGDTFEILNWINKLAGQKFQLRKDSETQLENESTNQTVTIADIFIDAVENYHKQLVELGITEMGFSHFLAKLKKAEKDQLKGEEDRRAFVKELVKDSLGKKGGEIPQMFPEEYADFSHSSGDFLSKQELRFPTSDKGRSPYWHANHITIGGRGLLLSAGIPADIQPNSKEMEEFLGLILFHKPSAIFAVAKFEEDIAKIEQGKEEKTEKKESKKISGLFKYIKPGFYGEKREFEVKVELGTNNQQVELTIINHLTGETHKAKFINIKTDDNQPACFDFKGCQEFLSLYDSLPIGRSQPIMIHCMSGIGRTAFFAMLFLLMDTISQRYDIEKSLLKSLRVPVDKHDLEKILEFRQRLLLINEIRAIRPFMQDKTHQGNSIVKQLILLLLVKRKFIYQGIWKQTKTDLSFNYPRTFFRKYTQKEIEQDTIHMSIVELKEIFEELEKSGHDGIFVKTLYKTFIGNSSFFNNKKCLENLKSVTLQKHETAADFNNACLKIISQLKDWESRGEKYGKLVELIKAYCDRRELKVEIKSEQCSIM